LGGDPNDIDLEYDPFTENVENLTNTYHLIGHAYCYTDTVYHLQPLEEDTMAIIDDHGTNQGALKVSLLISIEGLDLESFDTLKDLLGKELSLNIKVHEAIGIPENFSSKTFCSYSLAGLNNEEFKTPVFEETTTNPKFNYSVVHKLPISREVADDFLNRALTVSVYGDMSTVKKEREMGKLKASAKGFSQSFNVKVKNNKDLDMFSHSALIPEESHSAYLGPSIIMNPMSADSDSLRVELEMKEQQLQKIKAEQLKKEMEYSKRIKELEDRERELNIAPKNRGSSCCTTF